MGTTYTVTCDAHDRGCPPRSYVYITVEVPEYSLIVNRLPEGPDPPPFCGPYCPIVNEALENPATFNDEPVSAMTLNPRLKYDTLPVGFGGRPVLKETERDGQEESARSVGTVGFDIGSGIGAGYGHDYGMGGVRMGHGSDLGIDGYRGGPGVAAD